MNQGEKPFGHLLAESMKIKLGHFPEPATSIPHMVWQLQRAIGEQVVSESMALFFLTSVSRSIYFDAGQWKEIQVNRDEIPSQNFYKYIHSEELADFLMNCYVLALQRMCQQNGIDDYYISCFDNLNLYLNGIDKTKFYQEGKISLADILGCRIDSSEEILIDRLHPMIYPNHCHPNQQGHQMIANKLNQWINTR